MSEGSKLGGVGLHAFLKAVADPILYACNITDGFLWSLTQLPVFLMSTQWRSMEKDIWVS